MTLAATTQELPTRIVPAPPTPDVDSGTPVLFEPSPGTILVSFWNMPNGSAKPRVLSIPRKPILANATEIRLATPIDFRFTSRMNELKQIEEGWGDGTGIAPGDDFLDWATRQFSRHYPKDLPAPYIYPTMEGGLEIEWPLGPYEASLTIDQSRRAVWHSLNLETDSEDEHHLSMDEPLSWRRLEINLRELLSSE